MNLSTDEAAQAAFKLETAPTTNVNVTSTSPLTPVPQGFTEEDLNRVRETEKNKLYPQIESLKGELETFKKEKAAKEAEEALVALQLSVAARKREEEDMDLRTLIDSREKEWEARLDVERKEREAAFALVAREKEYSTLTEHRNRRTTEERDNIMPELLDLITGNSTDEIEQSIAGLRDKTTRILESVKSATQNTRKEMAGTRVTIPGEGPLENNLENQSFTAEDIAAMSQTEYAKHRSRLLGTAATSGGKGLFG